MRMKPRNVILHQGETHRAHFVPNTIGISLLNPKVVKNRIASKRTFAKYFFPFTGVGFAEVSNSTRVDFTWRIAVSPDTVSLI